MLDELEAIGYKALAHAKKEFYDFLSNEGYEGAFFDIKFIIWITNQDFTQRLRKLEIEDEIK